MQETRDDIIKEVELQAKLHASKETRCTLAYYFLGFLMVFLNLLSSMLIGSKGIYSRDSLELTIFVMTLIASILGLGLSFFKIEVKIQKHHTSSFEYSAMKNELLCDKFADKESDLDDVLKRKQLIDKHAPLTDYCLL